MAFLLNPLGYNISSAKHLYDLKAAVDRYPERLREVVSKIKDCIDQETYDYLMEGSKWESLEKKGIKAITGTDRTPIVEFKKVPNYVLKASRGSVLSDLARMVAESIFAPLGGRFFIASNREGSVATDLFSEAKRVLVAKKLRKIIKRFQLSRIRVPKKYLCSFPDRVLEKLALPFGPGRTFVLCEKCEVEHAGELSYQELKKMAPVAVEELAQQLQTFLMHSGVLDLHPGNFYIKDGQMVIFDTQPMSLVPTSQLTAFPRLKEARVNFRNLHWYFSAGKEAKPIRVIAKRSIRKLNDEETKGTIRALCALAVLVLGVMVLNRYAEGGLGEG